MSNYDNLLGLPYEEGQQDCFSLVRRYYRQVWGVDIPNFARPHNFWEDPNLDLYQLYKLAGFEQVFDVPFQKGDGLLMPLFTPFATHGAILAEDNVIIHHLPRRLSNAEPFRPRWSSKVTIVIRHPEVTSQLRKLKPKPTQLHEVLDAQLFRTPEFQEAVARAVDT
jgi:cell wall-associated NlpC family hydrolase